MKYMMFTAEMSKGLKKEVPVIFPDFMVHSHIAEVFGKLLKEVHGFKKVKVISAGEFSTLSGETSGGSTTLNCKSRKEDEAIIRTYDYLHGM